MPVVLMRQALQMLALAKMRTFVRLNQGFG